jgi:TolB-like protein/Flp pilus assembly protein TadD
VSTLNSSQTMMRFGDFDVDLRSGELRRHGVRIKLQIQPFQVLQMLLERAGEVVTREELRKQLWPADTFVDFDHGLNNVVKKLREALADDAEKPRFIETLARRGYRFIGSAEHVANAQGEPTVSTKPAANDSIAVLPFVSMTLNPQDELFSDGITEEIINALAQIEQLHVVARSSAFSFKGKHIDVRVVGKQLNVRTVLLGSIRRADNKLRIGVQLVNAADGYHIWSERYDRELKDIFDIQDEIARSIAIRLKVAIENRSQQPLVRAGTKNPEAYSLYVKGRALLYRRGTKIPVALECFKQAVMLDPEYALAWAGIADAYTLLGFYGLTHPLTVMPKWREAAARAVALDDSLAEAHNALAFGTLLYDWNKTLAEREFLRALELNPRYVQARDWYACFYLQAAAGRLDDGVEHAKLAVEADPLSSYANSILALLYGATGRHTDAEQTAQRAVELDSDSFLPRWTLQMVLRFASRFEEAVGAGQTALAMSGRHPWAMSILAVTLADWGKTAEAQAVYDEMTARSRREYVLPAALAVAAGAAARRDEAMRHAREALRIHDPYRSGFTTYWGLAARLRADSQIDHMIKESGID